ncbi:MAG: 4-vinyl reductase [Chloroflexota bacterium]|nr:MAG: 4-vinyl reductase [Chloroflexota bacterium]
MDKIPECGYFNSNRFARIFLESIQEITGQGGINSILNYAGLESLINNFPPDDLERAFDFANFANINQALIEIYGERGGRGLSLRVGRITFTSVLRDYGAMAGVGDLAFKILPKNAKIKFGLEAMARIFSEKSDQISSLTEERNHFIYKIERCPVCWGRKNADQPVCYYMVGLIQEGLHWVSGGKEFQVAETKCMAIGDQACEFEIKKENLK